tara:strand:- start:409 stop:1323 length:915 start_codon:yes stop_codon:yes gene_type:complete
MTVYRVALRSFEEVEKHYCSVKPIRGTSIRPIGKRARKHEHIVKVSDDRYDIMSAFSALEYPIVSWLRSDGDTYVHIYNHGVASSYRYLERVIPAGLFLAISQSGNHRISWVESPLMDVGSGEAFIPDVHRSGYKCDYVVPHLRFIRDGDCWRQVGTKFYPPRRRVRKEAKQPYRKAIAKFYDDLLVMIPMLRDSFTKQGVGYANSALQGGGGRSGWGGYLAHSLPMANLYREILLDEEHGHRADLMIAIIGSLEQASLHQCDGNGKNVPIWKRTNLRNSYNNWINERLFFTETVFEQEEIPNE